MATKKKSQIDALSPDSDSRPTKKQAVTAKHVVTYEAPEIVEIPLTDEDIEENPTLVEFEEDEPVYKPPSFRQKLKNKFEQKGIGGTETLTMRIDRLPHYDMNGMAGVRAEKEFCGVITCTEKFFDSDDYLIEIQRRYGPGEYWIVVRHKNTIVQQWRERVGGFPAQPVVTQTVSENGQVTPTVIYQQPQQAQPPAPVIDPLVQLRSAFKIVKEFKEDLGIVAPQAQQQPQAPVDPDAILIQNLAHNDKFMDRLGSGLVSKVFNGAGIAEDPSLSSVAMEVVKTNQLAPAIREIMNGALNIVRQIFPTNGGNNGQAPMGQTPLQNHGTANQNQSTQSPAPLHAIQDTQTQPQGAADMGNAQPSLLQLVQMLPYQHALNLMMQSQGQLASTDLALAKVMDGCMRNIQVERIADWLFGFADILNAQLPDHSIDGYIDMFGAMSPDEALTMLKNVAGPIADQIAALEHSRPWIESLKKLINENVSDDEGEEE